MNIMEVPEDVTINGKEVYKNGQVGNELSSASGDDSGYTKTLMEKSIDD